MIIIKKTNKCDTRTLKEGQNFNTHDVESDTLKHQEAVVKSCDFIADKLSNQAMVHDFTKLNALLPMFTEALSTGRVGDEFKKLRWWLVHTVNERHHLNDYCPEDVNLIDVIEMICDCVCAGKARTGEVFPIELSNEILQKAVKNTTQLLIDNIEVEDE